MSRPTPLKIYTLSTVSIMTRPYSPWTMPRRMKNLSIALMYVSFIIWIFFFFKELPIRLLALCVKSNGWTWMASWSFPSRGTKWKFKKKCIFNLCNNFFFLKECLAMCSCSKTCTSAHGRIIPTTQPSQRHWKKCRMLQKPWTRSARSTRIARRWKSSRPSLPTLPNSKTSAFPIQCSVFSRVPCWSR